LLFYVIIIGLGALAGVLINILINQRNLIYSVIGSLVILLTGAFACFVLYYPFYFRSYYNLIITLVIMAVIIIAIYVGLRLIVNVVMSRNSHPAFADNPGSDAAPVQGKSIRVAQSRPAKNRRKKTIGNVEVARIGKATLQAPRPKPSKPESVTPAKVNVRDAQLQNAASAPASVSVASKHEEVKREPLAAPARIEIDLPEKIRPKQPAAESIMNNLENTAPETVVNKPQFVKAEISFTTEAREMAEESLSSIDAKMALDKPPISETVMSPASTTTIVEEGPAVVPEETIEEQVEAILEKEMATVAKGFIEEPIQAAIEEEKISTPEVPIEEPTEAIVENETATVTEEIIEESVQATFEEETAAVAETVSEIPAQAAIQEETAALPEAESEEQAEVIVKEETAAAAEVTSEEPVQAIIEEEILTAAEETNEELLSVAAVENKNEELQPATNSPQQDRVDAIIAKARELVNEGKYTYASQLIQACFNQATSAEQQKQADIVLLECLVLSNQIESARKKWLEVLNKMYILEPTDKIKLKEILEKLNNG
jgi:hypothetical protein